MTTEPMLAWYLSILLAGTAFGFQKSLHGRMLGALIALLIALGSFGLVGRALILTLFRGTGNDSSIAVLTIVLTVVAAYGVYVSQQADSKAKAAEIQLAQISLNLLSIENLKSSLELSLDRYRIQLEEAIKRGHILSLRHAVIAYLADEKDLPVEVRMQFRLVRRIVMDAAGRDTPSRTKFDCDEVDEALRSHNLDAHSLLGKAAEPFRELHRIADQYVARGATEW